MIIRYLPTNKGKGVIPFICSQSKRHQELLYSISNHRKSLGCRYCGEKHLQKLEFHHREPKEKLANISDLIKINVSVEDLRIEMLKCDVVCSKCHDQIHGRI